MTSYDQVQSEILYLFETRLTLFNNLIFIFQIPPPWVPGDEVQDEADFRHFQDFIENDLDIGFEAFECLPDEVPPPCEFNHL